MSFILIVNVYWLHFSGDTNIESQVHAFRYLRLIRLCTLCLPSVLPHFLVCSAIQYIQAQLQTQLADPLGHLVSPY